VCRATPPPEITIVNVCGERTNLGRLERLARKWSVNVVNTPESTRRLMRKRLYLSMGRLGTPMPPTQVISVHHHEAQLAGLAYPLWLKLPGHHHIDGEGVARVTSYKEACSITRRFHALTGGSTEVIAQGDIEADAEIKFYAVFSKQRDTLTFFSPHGALPDHLVAPLRQDCERIARATGVEVFGGDCLLHQGRYAIIDINSWPSFRLTFERGAHAITDMLRNDHGPQARHQPQL